MNLAQVEHCMAVVHRLGRDEFALFVRMLLEGLTFAQSVKAVGYATDRMSELQERCLADRSEYAQTLALPDNESAPLRARKIRALLHCKLYHGTEYGRELAEEFVELCKDPSVISYLKTVNLSESV